MKWRKRIKRKEEGKRERKEEEKTKKRYADDT